MQVKGSQRLHRLPGIVGRCDHLSDEVSGRARHSSTLGLSRADWAEVIQVSAYGTIRAHHWVAQVLVGSWHPHSPSVGTVPAVSGPHPHQELSTLPSWSSAFRQSWLRGRGGHRLSWGRGKDWPLLSPYRSLYPAFAEAGAQAGGLGQMGGSISLSGLS